MSITTLHGFLTAPAIGPGLPLQNRRPHHASNEHDRRHAFEPILYEGEVEGGGTIVVENLRAARYGAASFREPVLAFNDFPLK
jgi:hypothetical protein